MNAISVGDILSVVNRTDNTKFGIYTVTNKTSYTGFFEFNVTVISSNGDRDNLSTAVI